MTDNATASVASSEAPNAQPVKRNAAASKRRILNAALKEFSDHGHAGARIDTIAAKAGVSKPMIYAYFGDKDGLYKASLREAYVQIRQGEQDLNTDNLSPEDAVRELVRFSLDHFVSKPWFISMLNTENMRGGDTVRQIADVTEIQSTLIEQVRDILARGVAQGVFRDGVDPVDFYITIASLCYFPVSNKHTLRAVFKTPIDQEWLDRLATTSSEMLLAYLRPDATGTNT